MTTIAADLRACGFSEEIANAAAARRPSSLPMTYGAVAWLVLVALSIVLIARFDLLASDPIGPYFDWVYEDEWRWLIIGFVVALSVYAVCWPQLHRLRSWREHDPQPLRQEVLTRLANLAKDVARDQGDGARVLAEQLAEAAQNPELGETEIERLARALGLIAKA